MSRILRVVLTWMLAVALPLQGYAVHAMAACGPAHHRSAVEVAAVVAVVDMVQTADMVETTDMQSHHHDGAAGGHHATAMDQTDTSDDGVVSDGKAPHASKCSVCASCCSAAAIMTTAFTLDLVPVMPVTVGTVPAAHDRILSGGLERPPRLFLA